MKNVTQPWTQGSCLRKMTSGLSLTSVPKRVGQQGPPLPGHCWALRWREALCKAGEGPTLVAHRTWHHTGRGGAGVLRSEMEQDWAATLNWALRIWALSPVLLPLVPYSSVSGSRLVHCPGITQVVKIESGIRAPARR